MARTPDTSPQTLRVFVTLLHDPQTWRYGYELSRETGLASGTLYPILIRLAERDLLETRWEPATQPGRPPRHTYRLTSAGAELATDRIRTHGDVLADTTAKGRARSRTTLAIGTTS